MKHYSGTITDKEVWIEDYQFFVTASISYDIEIISETHFNPSEENIFNEIIEIQELKMNDVSEEMLVDITVNYKKILSKDVQQKLNNEIYPLLFDVADC